MCAAEATEAEVKSALRGNKNEGKDIIQILVVELLLTEQRHSEYLKILSSLASFPYCTTCYIPVFP